MKAVWSFWTKPFRFRHATAWASERHHLFSWVLSVETAKKHYSETSLYTDDEGVALLIDGIGLEFDHVSIDLNELHGHDPGWWMLGKLYTYRAQTMPFIHLDADVFLWKGLPESLHAASVFAQNPERFSFAYPYNSWYRPQVFESAIRSVGGWLPKEWSWYTSLKGDTAVCCGFLGANRLDFLSYYADQAIRMIEHPTNQTFWSQFNKIENNVLFEQYFLAACIEYYRHHLDTPYEGLRIEYLFDSMDAASQSTNSQKHGYMHLIAGAKANPVIACRLEERVKRDYSSYYHRIIRHLGI